jgi:6-pyruvoyl tetrahydropterin synthase-related domain
LNASHTIRGSGAGQAHGHTFELCLYIEKNTDDFVEFEQIEELINQYLNRFRGRLLNSIEPFDRLLPTVENLGRVFYGALSEPLRRDGYHLIRLEIGETPLSTFSVSDALFVGSLVFNDNHPASRLISGWVNTDAKGAG